MIRLLAAVAFAAFVAAVAFTICSSPRITPSSSTSSPCRRHPLS